MNGDKPPKTSRCAWCNRPVETTEFCERIMLPTSSMQMKAELLAGLAASPVMKVMTVADDAIHVTYRFCSKKHQEEYRKMVSKALAEAKGK